MPIYEYLCGKCGHEFEREQRITEDPVKTCPKCRSRRVKRLISQTSFVLKGGGWYADGYGNQSDSKKNESNSADSKSDSGGDSDKSSKSSDSSSSETKSSKGSGGDKKKSKKSSKSGKAAA